MKASDFFFTQPALVEIRQAGLTLRIGRESVDVPLDRQMNGRLTDTSCAHAAAILRDFLQRHGGKRHRGAICAMDARGISFRRLNLPRASDGELLRMLPLQIEGEFPLAPDALAWGYQRWPDLAGGGAAVPATQSVVVAAIRKEVAQDYADLLAEAGLEATFTLSAWVIAAALEPAWGHVAGAACVLHFDGQAVQWIRLDQGVVIETRSIMPAVNGGNGGLRETLQAVGESLRDRPLEGRLFLSGFAERSEEVISALSAVLGRPCAAEPMPAPTQPFRVLDGLETALARSDPGALPRLGLNQPGTVVATVAPTWYKWAALAAVLALAALGLRYAEALARGPGLERTLKRFDAQKANLPRLDREVRLLQHLAQSQPPYVEAMYVLATAAPPGTRLDSLSMTRRGDLSWRGMFANPQQAGDFRTRLVASEYFSSVVIEEQAPAPDRQRVSVRMTAQWKQADARPKLPDLPSTNSATNAPDGGAAPPPPPGTPVPPPKAAMLPGPPRPGLHGFRVRSRTPMDPAIALPAPLERRMA